MTELKSQVDFELKRMYSRIGIDPPENHSVILEYVYNKVLKYARTELITEDDILWGFAKYLERSRPPRGTL